MQNEVWNEDALLASRCSLSGPMPGLSRLCILKYVGSFPSIFSLETYVPAKALANRHCTD